jgi:hypothetical protein
VRAFREIHNKLAIFDKFWIPILHNFIPEWLKIMQKVNFDHFQPQQWAKILIFGKFFFVSK